MVSLKWMPLHANISTPSLQILAVYDKSVGVASLNMHVCHGLQSI